MYGVQAAEVRSPRAGEELEENWAESVTIEHHKRKSPGADSECGANLKNVGEIFRGSARADRQSMALGSFGTVGGGGTGGCRKHGARQFSALRAPPPASCRIAPLAPASLAPAPRSEARELRKVEDAVREAGNPGHEGEAVVPDLQEEPPRVISMLRKQAAAGGGGGA